MIKYPLYKKNNSRNFTLVYPGLTTASLDRIITWMRYYYVMCQTGPRIHRAYVRLDSESADILHDHLESQFNTCQVCPVAKADIDPDLLIK